jgi:hypothetical protein
MKTNIIVKAIVAQALLGGATTGLLAQNNDPVCPFGYEPGTGQAMTVEQRADHVAALQVLVQRTPGEKRRRNPHRRGTGLAPTGRTTRRLSPNRHPTRSARPGNGPRSPPGTS